MFKKLNLTPNFLFLVFILLNTPVFCLSETIKFDNIKLKHAELELTEERLLDVGIFIFDPNLPEDLDSNPLIFSEIREAEARYMPYHLKVTLEHTGYWGGVWVLPDKTKAIDLWVSGRIIKSDGYAVTIKIAVWDITGKEWIQKDYTALIGQKAYSKRRDLTEDPYQSIFNEIANDLQNIKSELSSKHLSRISEIGDLRFATDLLPGVFNDYLVKDEKTKIFQAIRLPADDDPVMKSIKKVKERELLLLDTLSEYYAQLYRAISVPYEDWRKSNRQNAINYQELKRISKKRKILGVVAILGGLMVDGDSNSSGYAQRTLMIGGYQGIQSGMAIGSEAKIYKESMKEGSETLAVTAEGLLIEVEGQTLRLTGNAQEMFLGWKKLLSQIYTEETGFTLTEESTQ